MQLVPEIESIVEAIAQRQRFLLVSHARPDGDSIGSELALAFALRSLGKDVRVVNRDPAPAYLHSFPGVTELEVTDDVQGVYDAVVVLECGSLERTEVSGLDRYFVINIDHHVQAATGLYVMPGFRVQAQEWAMGAPPRPAARKSR